jgi:hypothetical protein
MSIEHALHRALSRKPAPRDLADRVLARLEADGPRRQPRGHRRLRWLAAAAAIILTATGGVRYYTQQQAIAEAERVKQEIRIALQITSEKLAFAQERVARSADESPR